MPFQKGKEKTGGRAKGSVNKSTEKIRKALSAMIVGELPRLKDELSSLSGKDYVYAMDKMMAYVAPKPVETKSQIEMKSETTISQRDAEILKSIPSDVIASIAGQLQASMSTTLSANDGSDSELDVDDENEEAE